MTQEIIPIQLGFVKAFLIKGEKYILVDTGLKTSFKKIVTFLNDMGIKPQDISLIILTHNHMDHAGSIQFIKELTGAPVVIQKLEGENLINGKSSEVKPRSAVLRWLMRRVKDRTMPVFIPDVMFEDDFDLNDYGVIGKIIRTPGHTKGSVSVIADNQAIAGDLIRGKGNKVKFHFIADSIPDMKNSLKKLLDVHIESFYTSHGGICTAAGIKRLLENDKKNRN